MGRVVELTGTESPGAKRTCLGLLGSSTKGSGGLRLRLTEDSSSRTKSTGTCGCGAFEVSVTKENLKRVTRTKSTGGGFLTESVTASAEETTGLLLLLLLLGLLLWLCGTKSASAKAGRLLWLSLAKRTKRGPGLLLLWLLLLLLRLLLAKRTKPCSSGSTSGSKSPSTSPESGLSGLRCGLGLAEQPPRCSGLCCRAKRTSSEPPWGGCLTVLLVVL